MSLQADKCNASVCQEQGQEREAGRTPRGEVSVVVSWARSTSQRRRMPEFSPNVPSPLHLLPPLSPLPPPLWASWVLHGRQLAGTCCEMWQVASFVPAFQLILSSLAMSVASSCFGKPPFCGNVVLPSFHPFLLAHVSVDSSIYLSILLFVCVHVNSATEARACGND